MARQKKKSVLAGKMNEIRKAHEQHKGDEVVLSGNVSLPGGIRNGIARLIDCRFGSYATGKYEGEPFFIARGVVLEPEKQGKIPVRGKHTQIGPEPLCQTESRYEKARKSVDDHLAWIYNELRKLGVDTEGLDVDSLEEVAEALKQERPCFSFHTWQPDATKEQPDPDVRSFWDGYCDYEEDDEVLDDDVEDNTEEVEDNEELEDEDTPEDDPIGDDDLSSLGTLAEEDDDDAQAKLNTLAEAAGIDPDEYESWTDVADALSSSDSEEDEDENEKESEEEEAIVPEEGECYSFKPPRARKAQECKVTGVFPRKKTCNLKSLDTEKVYKGVFWDKLS
jgi:hypothetical protein